MRKNRIMYIVVLAVVVVAGFVLYLGVADIKPQERTVQISVEL